MPKRLLLPAYIVMILVVFILPFFSVEGYSILKNTTSHLGAQNTPNAWIMNTVFFLLGMACIYEGWFHLKGYRFQQIILIVFGASLFLTGIFKHAPINASLPYNLMEDELHSLFATIVGFSFTIFAISAAFIEGSAGKRILALVVGLSAIGFSGLIFVMTDFAGVWQRMMFMLAFAWLIFFFERIRANKSK